MVAGDIVPRVLCIKQKGRRIGSAGLQTCARLAHSGAHRALPNGVQRDAIVAMTLLPAPALQAPFGVSGICLCEAHVPQFSQFGLPFTSLHLGTFCITGYRTNRKG
jgi:hypothetical protein